MSRSLTDFSLGKRSQTTLAETRTGTDNKAAGTPQSQVQKIKETKTTTGLSVNRRPIKTGALKFANQLLSPFIVVVFVRWVRSVSLNCGRILPRLWLHILVWGP